MQRKIKKIGFVLVLFICSFIFLESSLRITSYIYLRLHRQQNFNVSASFNILCIGDSFTFGCGASPEKSWPRQLEQLLNEKFFPEKFRVVNLSKPGYNSSMALKALRINFDKYNPKIVLVMIGMNNTWNFTDSSYFLLNKMVGDNPWVYKMRWLDALLTKIRTYKLIKIFFINLMYKLESMRFGLGLRRAIIEKNPNLIFSSKEIDRLTQIATRYYLQAQYEQAETKFKEILELDPNSYIAHSGLGRIYFIRNREEDGIKELILAIKSSQEPSCVSYILSELKSHLNIKDYITLVKILRVDLVKKFGEKTPQRLIIFLSGNDASNVLSNIIKYDLSQMAQYVKQKGSEIIFLTYPVNPNKFRLPEDIFQDIAINLNVPLVDNLSLFNEQLRLRDRQSLFVADGHCTTGGYRLIAENIYKTLKNNNSVH